jgi:hypothetical protein
MAVSNTRIIYRGISTLETAGIFYNIGSKLLRYLISRKSMFFTPVICHDKLPQYFYNIGPFSHDRGFEASCRSTPRNLKIRNQTQYNLS